MDMRNTLRYLGVPVKTQSYLFGDNQAVVDNSSITHSTLSKRHNALSYHRVREAIAAGVLLFYWIDGKISAQQTLLANNGLNHRYGIYYNLSCSTQVTPRILSRKKTSLLRSKRKGKVMK
jgi:hypothetical protein